MFFFFLENYFYRQSAKFTNIFCYVCFVNNAMQEDSQIYYSICCCFCYLSANESRSTEHKLSIFFISGLRQAYLIFCYTYTLTLPHDGFSPRTAFMRQLLILHTKRKKTLLLVHLPDDVIFAMHNFRLQLISTYLIIVKMGTGETHIST